MSDFTVNKIKSRAVVKVRGGKTYNFDVAAIQLRFELNSIPTCTLSLPVGRDAANVNEVATIHEAVQDMTIQAEVEVFCEGQHRADSRGTTEFGMFPPGEFRVFRGYVIGTGWRRGVQQAQFTLHCIHWLVDLNFSSPLTRSTHPINPNIWFFPAGFGGGRAGAVLEGNFVGNTIPAEFFTDDVLDDFWAADAGQQGILGFFKALSSDDRFNYTALEDQGIGAGDNGLPNSDPLINGEALRALQRFEPVPDGEYVLGVPLPLEAGAWGEHAAANMTVHMGTEAMNGIETMTLWDKLSGQLHADFMYSIVPLVDKALIVPYVPGLRNPFHRTILADDYESIELHGDMPRPLRAVMCFVHMSSFSGAAISQANPINYADAGGVFDNPENKDGMILFKHMPLWLSIVQGFGHAGSSTPVSSTVRTATAVNAGVASPAPQAAKIVKDATPLWNKYAQTVYVHETLKNRQGTVSGPARFDIAPGSLIRIEAAEDRFVLQALEQQPTFYRATVLSITTIIDSEGQRAGTTLHLAHIRTEAENMSGAYSVDRHPFWKTKWAGCVLVEHPAFGQQTTKEVPPPEPDPAAGA